jgi:tetratricopeptide (TPR) repeat protein
LVAQRYDDSIAQLKKAIELDPTDWWIHGLLGWAYARKGNYAEAIAEHERMPEQAYAVVPENQMVASGIGWIYGLAGRRSDALRIAEEFDQLSSKAYVDYYCEAIVYAGLGDKDRAFQLLQRAYEERSGAARAADGCVWLR